MSVTLAGSDLSGPHASQVLDRQLRRFWIATPTPADATPSHAVEVRVSGADVDGGAAWQTAAARLPVGAVCAAPDAERIRVEPLAVRFALLDSRYRLAPQISKVQSYRVVPSLAPPVLSCCRVCRRG